MSLSERLIQPVSRKLPNRCKISLVLETLEDPDAGALRRAMDDPAYTTRGITDALQSEDISISESSVRRHRKGHCQCR